jgi:hypothetical protein
MAEKSHKELFDELRAKETAKLKTLLDEQRRINRQLRQQMIVLVTSALGLVAALAWNEAIQALFKQYLSTSDA